MVQRWTPEKRLCRCHNTIKAKQKILSAPQPSLLAVLTSSVSTTKKMPRILFVSGFHPATRARDLAYEFERYIPSSTRIFLCKVHPVHPGLAHSFAVTFQRPETPMPSTIRKYTLPS